MSKFRKAHVLLKLLLIFNVYYVFLTHLIHVIIRRDDGGKNKRIMSLIKLFQYPCGCRKQSIFLTYWALAFAIITAKI